MYLSTRSKFKLGPNYSKFDKLLGNKRRIHKGNIQLKTDINKEGRTISASSVKSTKRSPLNIPATTNPNTSKISLFYSLLIPLENFRNNKKLKISFLKKFSFEENVFFDLVEMLKFIKIFTSLDYENLILKVRYFPLFFDLVSHSPPIY